MEPLLSQAPFPLSLSLSLVFLLHTLFIQVCLELDEGLQLVCQLSVVLQLRTHAFPTFLLTSNQLFTTGTFNPPNYTRQLPSLPTQALSKPTAFFNYTIAGPFSSQTSD